MSEEVSKMGNEAERMYEVPSVDTRYYEIRLKGHLDSRWSEWFESMTPSNEENGEVILSGYLSDQAALHGVLAKIRDLGLPLLSLNSFSCENTVP